MNASSAAAIGWFCVNLETRVAPLSLYEKRLSHAARKKNRQRIMRTFSSPPLRGLHVSIRSFKKGGCIEMSELRMIYRSTQRKDLRYKICRANYFRLEINVSFFTFNLYSIPFFVFSFLKHFWNFVICSLQKFEIKLVDDWNELFFEILFWLLDELKTGDWILFGE